MPIQDNQLANSPHNKHHISSTVVFLKLPHIRICKNMFHLHISIILLSSQKSNKSMKSNWFFKYNGVTMANTMPKRFREILFTFKFYVLQQGQEGLQIRLK